MRSRLVALFVLLFGAAGVLASPVTTALTGRVVIGDAPGGEVTVTLTSASLQQPRTTMTAPSGRYWVEALPPGVYDVTFSRAGATSLTRRAIVELGRVARADARLELSEDEDSVTSTATTVSVAETSTITTHFADAEIDRLPVRRDPRSLLRLSPTLLSSGDLADVDGVRVPLSELYGQEIFEEVTILRGALPANQAGASFGVLPAARIRSGGETFSASLRDTITSTSWRSSRPGAPARDGGIDHFVEATAGGRIVRERLWFFAAAWNGDEANRRFDSVHGLAAKLTAAPGAAQSLAGSYIHAAPREEDFGAAASQLAAHYTLMPSHALTIEAMVRRTTVTHEQGPLPQFSFADNGLFLSASYFVPAAVGDHLLRAGVDLAETDASGSVIGPARGIFIADRWSLRRWTLDLGARRESGDAGGVQSNRISPRLAAMYDLHGDSRRALRASYSEYTDPFFPAYPVRETSVGYASAIGASGQMRGDVIRRSAQFESIITIELEADYRLFDRFEVGGSGTLAPRTMSLIPRRAGRGWIGAAFPVGNHEAGVTLLERYEARQQDTFATDLALRYSIPLNRFRITTAADVTNVFDQTGTPRTVRVWLRASL